MIVAIPLIMIASCGFEPHDEGEDERRAEHGDDVLGAEADRACPSSAARPARRPRRAPGSCRRRGASNRWPCALLGLGAARRPVLLPDAAARAGRVSCPQPRGGRRGGIGRVEQAGALCRCALSPRLARSGDGGGGHALQVRGVPRRAVQHGACRRPAQGVDAVPGRHPADDVRLSRAHGNAACPPSSGASPRRSPTRWSYRRMRSARIGTRGSARGRTPCCAEGVVGGSAPQRLR